MGRYFCWYLPPYSFAFGGLKELDGVVEFRLQNLLDHPFFDWPQTLLSYRVTSNSAINPQTHHLCDLATGKTIPFQITEVSGHGNLKKSDVLVRFLADLPASTERIFRLTPGGGQVVADRSPTVSVGETSEFWTVDTGPLQVRIPRLGSPVRGSVPGPVSQLSRGGSFFGSSTVSFEGTTVAYHAAQCIEVGPLLAVYELTYRLASGGEYVATVECAAGMDFVRIHEDMGGLAGTARGQFAFTWTGSPFTHRQMPNHPYPFRQTPAAAYEDYGWERLVEREINTHIGVVPGLNANGELAWSLSAFQPWPAFTSGSFASFWNEESSDAAAVFLDRADLWNDPDYPIWHATKRLSVNFALVRGELEMRYPLAQGSRSTGIGFYDHTKDRERMKQVERWHEGLIGRDGQRYSCSLFPTSHGHFLQSRYGTLDLDMVKEWRLDHGQTGEYPQPILQTTHKKSPHQVEREISASQMTIELAAGGPRQNSGFGPVPGRAILDQWLADYLNVAPQMSESQRTRVAALILLQGYIASGEDYMPAQGMLSGHPNFLSDSRAVPAGVSYLFPSHPMTPIWRAQFEKCFALNTHFHTRPPVEAWGSQGGRWTENLGTYVWGAIKPALRVDYLMRHQDGFSRVATPELEQVGAWIVNALSAPFAGENPRWLTSSNLGDMHFWGLVRRGDPPRRIHVPVGAHAERRKPPSLVWYMGTLLQRYCPLVAESLMWASRPDDEDQELLVGTPGATTWSAMTQQQDNRGTNPHLKSSKITGYGITLRAAVDTPNELSIHLQQIDDGPNYRWGVPAEGGCGLLYFFANGKGYSHNGQEDEGDRDSQDTDFGTNFGVWKGGRFRAIGQNALTRPFYAFADAQFAELVPRQGEDSYCTPEYVSRSVVLVGSDYFLIHDRVFNESIGQRFSWFVALGDDFPHLTPLRKNKDTFRTTKIETSETEGVWFDGTGDSLVCVTHLSDIAPTATAYGAHVATRGTTDIVVLSETTGNVQEEDLFVVGSAAVIRRIGDEVSLNLFHGEAIGCIQTRFDVPHEDFGLSVRVKSDGQFEGALMAPQQGAVVITAQNLPAAAKLYLNGEEARPARSANRMTIQVAQGLHRIELTVRDPQPAAPRILRTEYLAGGAEVFVAKVGGASRYRLEISRDGGATWTVAAEARSPHFRLSGLESGKKVHVRAFAGNATRISEPGDEYPIYGTTDAPLPPEGLRATLYEGRIRLEWGQVLGVMEYRLYRKAPGSSSFERIYAGLERSFVDHADGLVRPRSRPVPDSSKLTSADRHYQYCVTSVSGNGEGSRSRSITSDAASWLNWSPTGDEPFRRGIAAGDYGTPPNDGLGFYYPKRPQPSGEV